MHGAPCFKGAGAYKFMVWKATVRAALLALGLCASLAHAEDRPGTFEVIVGGAQMAPDTSSSELVGGAPKESSIVGTGTLNSGAINPLGYTTALSPTLLARYHFLDASSAWRPSVALDINDTRFVRSSVSTRFQQFLSSQFSGGATTAFPSTVSFTSSWNPAFGLGLAYRLSKDWKVDLSATYIPLETVGTIHTNAAGTDVVSEGSMKVNPTIWAIGLSRQF